MEKLSEFFKKIWAKFQSFGKWVKIAIIVAIVAIIIAIISTIVVSSSNKYAVLFSNLDSTDAETISAKLTEDKVEMKVQGSSILVPKDQVDKLRLELASSITSGSKGYELMDSQSSFGMTDAQFDLQKQRMIQGELEKAIKALDPVETAKVLITPATDSVFVKDKKEGKAAVVIKLKTGYKIQDEQVQDIVALVSASTENIPKENIEVSDNKMNLLTKNTGSDGTSVGTSTVESDNKEKEKVYEDKLNKNVIALLEPIVGVGKVKAQANVDFDFDSVKKSDTVIDPNKALISQDITREYNNNNGGSTSASPVDNNMSNTIATGTTSLGSNKEQQVNNYDHSKSETQTIKAPGEIRRLTASIVIDGNLDAATQTAFENAVKAAIGFDPTRKDELSVLGMSFDPAIDAERQSQVDALNQEIANNNRNKYIIFGLIGLAVLVIIIVVVVIVLKKRRVEDERLLDVTLDDDLDVPSIDPVHYEPLNFDKVEDESSHKENEIKKYAKDKPEQVAEIIKSWLSENER